MVTIKTSSDLMLSLVNLRALEACLLTLVGIISPTSVDVAAAVAVREAAGVALLPVVVAVIVVVVVDAVVAAAVEVSAIVVAAVIVVVAVTAVVIAKAVAELPLPMVADPRSLARRK